MTDVEEKPILATVVPEPSDPVAPHRRKVYSVPRRFGLGTIFVVTTLFAVLFGILTGIGVPGEFILILAGFLTIIGFAQMLLFGGKHPRLASVETGMILTPIIVIAEMFYYDFPFGSEPFEIIVNSVRMIQFGIALGMINGYTGGGVVAGVFLIMDHVERKMYGKRENGEHARTSSDTGPADDPV